jgi:hypothetical protein
MHVGQVILKNQTRASSSIVLGFLAMAGHQFYYHLQSGGRVAPMESGLGGGLSLEFCL